jgi:hypothetical protein
MAIHKYTFNVNQVTFIQESLELLKSCVENFGQSCGLDDKICADIDEELSKLNVHIQDQHSKAFDMLTDDEFVAECISWNDRDLLYSCGNIDDILCYFRGRMLKLKLEATDAQC